MCANAILRRRHISAAADGVRLALSHGGSMRVRIFPCLLACVLIGLACTDVAGPGHAGRRYVGYSPTNSLQPGYTDWYQCWSTDAGQTWDCVYERTDVNMQDYWDLGDDSFYTTGQCHTTAQYCDTEFHPGGGGPYTAPRSLVRAAAGDDAVILIPTCPAPAGADPKIKAWCAGHIPNSTELPRINAALSRMHQIGGVCDALATIGDALIAHNTLRIFPQSNYTFGGAAPHGGGSSGPNSWAIVSRDFTAYLYDSSHAGVVANRNTGLRYHITLQSELAHELDHLNGASHIVENGIENLALTPNEAVCSDVSMGTGY